MTSPEHPARAGPEPDPNAGFVEIFAAHRQAVFSTALRLSGRWADAEDLTAEAFLRAYRALRGYPPERIAALRPRVWLVTILLNVWRNSRRSAARTVPVSDAPDPPERLDPDADVGLAAERQETGRELAAMLACLPEDQRVAVVLRHVSDLPVAEIARILNCPQGTVKARISRGLTRLRALHSHPDTQRGAR